MGQPQYTSTVDYDCAGEWRVILFLSLTQTVTLTDNVLCV